MKSIRLLFPLLLLTGCLIEPIGDNFTKVDPDPDPAFRGNVYYSYNGSQFLPLIDTLWIYDNAYLELKDGAAYRYEVSLDGEVIRPYNDPAFVFNLPDLSPGNYSLQVKHLAKSGTHSLADQVGAEYVEYTKTYVLSVTDDLYVPVITSIENVDGTVKIKWPKVRNGLVEKLRILKYTGTDFVPYRALTITDRSVNELDDTTYVGRVIRYRLEVTQGGTVTMSPEKEFYVSYTPNMMLTEISPGRLKLTWATSPFYRNVDHFQISMGGGAVIIQDNVDPELRSVEFNGSVPYGTGNLFRILLVSKVPAGEVDYTGDAWSYQDALALGKRLPGFRKIEHSTGNDVFYLTYEPTSVTGVLGYYKLDANFNVLDSVVWPYDIYEATAPVNFYLSPNGQHLYTLKNFRVERRNVNNLADKVVYTLPDLGLPNQHYENFYRNENFAVSNNNLMLVRLNGATGIESHVVNMTTQQRIFTFANSGHTHLSGDGKYFINNNGLYKFNGTTYQPDFLLPYSFGSIKYVQFLDSNPAEVIILTSTKVIRYNCDTHTELAAWDCTPHNSPYPHFDQATKKLLYKAASATYMTLDLMTGTTRSLTGSDYFTVEDDVLFVSLSFGFGFGLRNY